MDIVKHIIREELIRKQMYDNHECTALEVEGRSFNEKILALGKRIEELEAQLEKVREIYMGAGCNCIVVRGAGGIAKSEHETCPMCEIGKVFKQAILEKEDE